MATNDCRTYPKITAKGFPNLPLSQINPVSRMPLPIQDVNKKPIATAKINKRSFFSGTIVICLFPEDNQIRRNCQVLVDKLLGIGAFIPIL